MQVSSGIERAFKVIYYIAETENDHEAGEGDFGVSEIARGLGLSKTVVHRILRTLVVMDFLSVSPKTRRYKLGPGAMIVGQSAFKQMNPYRATRPSLERLAAETQETATLAIRRGGQRVYMDQVISEREVKMSVQVGSSSPLHAGGPAKAILATLPESEVQAYLDAYEELPRFTTQTIVDRSALEEDLRNIRELGYAVSFGERQTDAFSVAAPIFEMDGRVFGAISICGPAQRFDAGRGAEYGRLLRREAGRLSYEFGYQGSWFSAGS